MTQCQYWNLISKYHLYPYATLRYQTNFLAMLASGSVRNLSVLRREKIYIQFWILQVFCLRAAHAISKDYYVFFLRNKCILIGPFNWDS